MADFFRGLTDIGMTLDGDLMVGPDGDLQIVEGFEWLYREVNKRIRTDNPSWRLHPSIGANLGDFQGYPNTEETARRLRQRIKYVLGKDNIAFPGQFSVRVVPIRPDGIAILIYLDLAGNRVELSKAIYDFHDGLVQPMEDPAITTHPLPQEMKLINIDNTPDPKVPNKYQARIALQQNN